MFRRLTYLLAPAGIVVLLIFVADGVKRTCWIAFTDLEIVFVVTDSATGEPLEGAEISIHAGPDSDLAAEERSFALRADHTGTATRLRKDTSMSGTTSGLGFTDRWSVRVPDWHFRVSAPGRKPTDWLGLCDFSQDVEHLGPGRSRLVVRIALDTQP